MSVCVPLACAAVVPSVLTIVRIAVPVPFLMLISVLALSPLVVALIARPTAVSPLSHLAARHRAPVSGAHVAPATHLVSGTHAPSTSIAMTRAAATLG